MSVFEYFFEYCPHSNFDIGYGKQEGVKEDLIGDALRVENFIEKFMKIHI